MPTITFFASAPCMILESAIRTVLSLDIILYVETTTTTCTSLFHPFIGDLTFIYVLAPHLWLKVTPPLNFLGGIGYNTLTLVT